MIPKYRIFYLLRGDYIEVLQVSLRACPAEVRLENLSVKSPPPWAYRLDRRHLELKEWRIWGLGFRAWALGLGLKVCDFWKGWVGIKHVQTFFSRKARL